MSSNGTSTNCSGNSFAVSDCVNRKWRKPSLLSKPPPSFSPYLWPFCISFAFLCLGATRRRDVYLTPFFFLPSASPLNSWQHLIKKGQRNPTPATAPLSGRVLDIHTPAMTMIAGTSALCFASCSQTLHSATETWENSCHCGGRMEGQQAQHRFTSTISPRNRQAESFLKSTVSSRRQLPLAKSHRVKNANS